MFAELSKLWTAHIISLTVQQCNVYGILHRCSSMSLTQLDCRSAMHAEGWRDEDDDNPLLAHAASEPVEQDSCASGM